MRVRGLASYRCPPPPALGVNSWPPALVSRLESGVRLMTVRLRCAQALSDKLPCCVVRAVYPRTGVPARGSEANQTNLSVRGSRCLLYQIDKDGRHNPIGVVAP